MLGTTAPGFAAGTCARCATQLAPTLLACPTCQALVHAETLKRLASSAEAAESAGELTVAMTRWRDALELLPPQTTQHAAIVGRVSSLGRRLDAGERPIASRTAVVQEKGSPLRRGWGAIVAAALFLVTKGKLLLLGLTKASTLVSMLAFLGVYWRIWGWPYALGFVVCIYIHEMGHVAALARYGIRASAPLFIPGVGALVQLRQSPADARQDARIGLAGPVWGLGAALAAFGIHLATGAGIWGGIARSAAVLNLFNLTPVWQLDGGRGFRALSRPQRWAALLAIGVVGAMTLDPWLVVLGIATVSRALAPAPREPDHPMLALYVALVAALAWLATTPLAGFALGT